MTPFQDKDGVWLRCALHAHTTNSDGEMAPGHARPALRMGRLRRPRDHRPLGADGRALDPEAPRHPVRRAERDLRRAGARRARARPRRRGRPGRSRRTSSRRCRRWSPGSRRTAASPISPTRTGAGCAPSSGRRARACSASRCGTPAASSRSAAATRPSTGTRRSSAGAASSRSRPTTRTTPATTAASRGRWCARRTGRRRRCSPRCAAVPSTARPAPTSTM